MITGMHVLLPSSDAVADRAFLRDVFGWTWQEDEPSGAGWLIFALPPSELGVHPGASAARGAGTTLHLMCDDLEATLADLAAHGVAALGEPRDAGYGLVSEIALPSGGTLGLYEPHHATPLGMVRERADGTTVVVPPHARREPSAGFRVALLNTVLECLDARALARFYQRLLGWRLVADEPDWVTLRPHGGGSGLAFSSDPMYRPPVWPATAEHNQMQAHLDLYVDDMSAAAEHAVAAGARYADFQPQDAVRVMIDPAGHPFCLFEA